jgi:hypothetical protein
VVKVDLIMGEKTEVGRLILRMPFISLGLSISTEGTIWKLGIVMHDRDDAAGIPSEQIVARKCQ